MPWWNNVLEKIHAGDEFLTPGRGVDGGTRRRSFHIERVDPVKIIVKSGRSQIPLERQCFDAVEGAFQHDPFLKLRVAAKHGTAPFPDSADAIIREATRNDLARGNYVCAILENLDLVTYSMIGGRKVIKIS